MFEKWVCVNMKCGHVGEGIKGDRCPICGRNLHKVDSKEFKRIKINKSKFEDDPDWLRKKAAINSEKKEREYIPDEPKTKKSYSFKIVLGLLTLFFLFCIFSSLNAGTGLFRGFWIFFEFLILVGVIVIVFVVAAWIVGQFVKLIREFST